MASSAEIIKLQMLMLSWSQLEPKTTQVLCCFTLCIRISWGSNWSESYFYINFTEYKQILCIQISDYPTCFFNFYGSAYLLLWAKVGKEIPVNCRNTRGESLILAIKSRCLWSIIVDQALLRCLDPVLLFPLKLGKIIILYVSYSPN